jgi:hypothetical protein
MLVVIFDGMTGQVLNLAEGSMAFNLALRLDFCLI